jgi:hypothetical protein
MRAAGLGLCFAAILGASGCATILHPERALIPKNERGEVDLVMAVADTIISIPTYLFAMLAIGLGGGSMDWSESSPLFFALWLDQRQGTLWHPAPDYRPSVRE